MLTEQEKEAFRKGASQYATNDLGLEDKEADHFVDIVEKQADELSVALAIDSDGDLDKSAANEDNDALDSYLCKRAAEITDECGGPDELRKQAQSFYTNPARGLPGHMQQSGLPMVLDNALSKTDDAGALIRQAGKGRLGKILAAILGTGAGGYGLYKLLSGGEEESGLMDMVAENAPEAAGAGIGGLGGERLANELSDGDTLARILGGGAGAVGGGVAANQLEELASA